MSQSVNINTAPVSILAINGKKQPAVTSLQIAEVFGKMHQDVLRDIREILSKCSQYFGASNFAASSYKSRQNKEMPMYLLSRDGFMLVVMGYTGDEAMRLKEAWITKFNEMEEALRHTSAAAVTSSLQVAEAFEKQHLHVMRDIREILSKCSQQFGESNFGLSSFQSRQNKEMPMYVT